jgi:hypothetical protein
LGQVALRDRGPDGHANDAWEEETMSIEELYVHSVIREHDEEIRVLDLLQAWGEPLHTPLRARIGAGFVRLGKWLQGGGVLSSPQCPSTPR